MFSLDQYNAAKERAAVIDRSPQGKISLHGADRASFLHSLLTNDIARLTAGTGTYAAYLTPQGRMISDMRVVETGDEIVLGVEPLVVDSLAERLDKLIFSEDVQVKNVTAERAQVTVCGPLAGKALEGALGIPAARVESMNEYDNLRALGSVMVVRDDAWGMMGFDLFAPAAEGAGLLEALTHAGAARITEETTKVLRIEAGRPRFGLDMDTDTIPLEAGIEDRAISLTKGCYVGQEVIVRVLHRGHGRVAKKLVKLVMTGPRIPARADVIVAHGQDVGRITSAVFSPMAAGPLALAYVHRDHTADGAVVTVRSGGESLEATVSQLNK
jgi:folate-binding protein YgfZ